MLKSFLFIFIVFNTALFAEESSETLKKIEEKRYLIENAAMIFKIDPSILAAVIYTERRLNFSWEDEAVDILLAEASLNSSVGFCQVKMKTAYWLEIQFNDSTSVYHPGKEFSRILKVSSSPKEIIAKLQNDSLNILYAAAYLRIIESRWENAGHPIKNRPAILGTLYSTGLFYEGEERKPNANPKANRFGDFVENSVKIFRR